MKSEPIVSFTGKSVIVTGAARGIGAGIAQMMALLGAKVALVDSDETALQQCADEIRDCYGDVTDIYSGDVRDAEFLSEMTAAITARRGQIDVLVNNAGIIRDNLIGNISEDDWDDVLTVNLKGAFLTCKVVAPEMKRRQYGSIVNIVSRAWLGSIGQANYSASKGGLVSLTRTLALEFARDNITVNAVAPGLIDTPMTQQLSEKVMSRLLKAQPGGRAGTVDDIASAVCYLASGNARFITGQIIHVDGGKSCGSLSL